MNTNKHEYFWGTTKNTKSTKKDFHFVWFVSFVVSTEIQV